MIKKLSLAALGLIFSAAAAFGQATVPAGGVMGNSTASERTARAETLTAIIDRALGSTRGSIIARGASGWAILPPGATAGQIIRSGGTGANPSYSTATYPATTTINRLLYSSAANTISELATANSSILVTNGSGVPSLSTTLPAFTLGGTVSGGGNQINNVIIGTTSPLAGSFTSLAYSTTLTGTSTSASCAAIGRQGATNPVLLIDCSTASVATGLKVKGAAAAAGLALSVITSGTNENLTIDAAGSGTITFAGTSTGDIVLSRNVGVRGAMTGTQTGLQITDATQPMLVMRSTGGTATKQMGRLIYDPASALSNPGFIFQTLSDAGVFASNDNVFWNGGGISVGNITYPGAKALSVTGISTFTGAVGVNNTLTVTSASANALAVGRQGTTNPAFQVDASAATSVTGWRVTSNATGGAAGAALTVVSSATNEYGHINAKGNAILYLNDTGTGTISLGAGGGGIAMASFGYISSNAAQAFAVGPNGQTNPVFQVDGSTASQAAGLKVTGAATAGTVAIVATDSGAAANLSANAKGAGSIKIGDTSTGGVEVGAGGGTIKVAGLTVSASTGTLSITNGKTLSISNTMTQTATDGSTVAFGGGGNVTYTVATGTKALATGAISSASCTSAQTDTATGAATTDVVDFTFASDPTAVTGYVPLTSGMLAIIPYATSNTVNFKVCNNTAGSITPGAISLNWRVRR